MTYNIGYGNYQPNSFGQPQSYGQVAFQPQYQNVQSIPMQSGLVCRPVASREEAAQTQIPFDGNPYVFINLMAGEIYTKQFNTLTGNTELTTYSKSAPERTDGFATKAELEALRTELEKMRKPGRKKEIADDE